MVDEAFAVEKQRCDALLTEGRRQADLLYEEEMKKAEQTCEDLRNMAAVQKSRAIKFIAERIVDPSGCC